MFFYYKYDLFDELVYVEFNGAKYYYVKDVLGNINSIIDDNGRVVVTYEYDEWGNSFKNS